MLGWPESSFGFSPSYRKSKWTFFKLEYNCFTGLCYIHIPLLSWVFLPPPAQAITEPQAELPVLYSIFPLVTYFTHGSVYMSVFPSQWHFPSLHKQQYAHAHRSSSPSLSFVCLWSSLSTRSHAIHFTCLWSVFCSSVSSLRAEIVFLSLLDVGPMAVPRAQQGVDRHLPDGHMSIKIFAMCWTLQALH